MLRRQMFLQCLFFPLFTSGFSLPLSNHDRSSILGDTAAVVDMNFNNDENQPIVGFDALGMSTNQSSSSFSSSSFSFSSNSSSSSSRSSSWSSSSGVKKTIGEKRENFSMEARSNKTDTVNGKTITNSTHAAKMIWVYTPESNGTLISVLEDNLPLEYWVPIRNKLKYWPNRTISVVTDDRFRSSEVETIWAALKALSKVLDDCVSFIEKPDEETDYLHFRKAKSCDSKIGYKGGRHVVKLSDGCLDPEELGAIQHETLHALGFFHEHSRKDRDDFVEVNWSNVVPKERADFKKLKFKTFGLPYDYTSVMHYASDAYAIKEDVPTLKAKKFSVNATMMGQRIGLSRADVIRVKIPYKCQLPESVKSWLEAREASKRTARFSDDTDSDEDEIEDPAENGDHSSA